MEHLIHSDLKNMCERFNPELLYSVTITDSITALSYLVFSLVLVLLWRKFSGDLRPLKIYWWTLTAFVAFCGAGHLLHTLGLWNGGVWWYIEAVWYWGTAIISAFSAILASIACVQLLKGSPALIPLKLAIYALIPSNRAKAEGQVMKLERLFEQMKK